MAELGIRVIIRLDYGSYLGLQLHLKDKGGAIIETSTDPRSDRPNGPRHNRGGLELEVGYIV